MFNAFKSWFMWDHQADVDQDQSQAMARMVFVGLFGVYLIGGALWYFLDINRVQGALYPLAATFSQTGIPNPPRTWCS